MTLVILDFRLDFALKNWGPEVMMAVTLLLLLPNHHIQQFCSVSVQIRIKRMLTETIDLIFPLVSTHNTRQLPPKQWGIKEDWVLVGVVCSLRCGCCVGHCWWGNINNRCWICPLHYDIVLTRLPGMWLMMIKVENTLIEMQIIGLMDQRKETWIKVNKC